MLLTSQFAFCTMSDKFLFFNNLKKCKNFFRENINKRKHLIFQGVKHVWRFFLTE